MNGIQEQELKSQLRFKKLTCSPSPNVYADTPLTHSTGIKGCEFS